MNNAFGQGLTTTQIQLAAGYAAVVNGGYYIQPTIIHKIIEKKKGNENQEKFLQQVTRQVFKPETSSVIRDALLDVLSENPGIANNASISGYALGGKSGTAQISYKGRYQGGN